MISEIIRQFEMSSEGERNMRLNHAAYQLARHGWTLEQITAALTPIARSIGLRASEVRKTVRSAHEKGHRSPFQPITDTEPQGKKTFPPVAEVREFWRSCHKLDISTHVNPPLTVWRTCAYLRGNRSYSLDEIQYLASRDMIRALCEDHTHAWWRRSWYPEWCLIVGAYNHQGDMVSVHARAVSPKTTPKTRWPYGHTSKGTVFANRTGVRFLRGHIPQDGVVLVEGATDTLCATVRLRAMGKHAAVIGIHSGAISAFTQIHWPVGIHVRPWIDTDSAGRKYLEKIKKILKNRHVVLYKNKVNDRHG